MNSNNIVKIGTALKWRSTYSDEKRYYQENIVTTCGCVFRCKVLQATGKCPVKVIDEYGRIKYDNVDIWDVVVDMAYYYNFTIELRELVQRTIARVTENEKNIQANKDDIGEIKKDDLEQWEHINNIEKLDEEQGEKIEKIEETHLNDIERLSQSMQEIEKGLRQELKLQQETIEEQQRTITEMSGQIEDLQNRQALTDEQQEQLDEILAMFSLLKAGVWCNSLYWSNEDYWQNDTSGMQCSCGSSSSLSATYDSGTQTVTLNSSGSLVESYDEPTQTINFEEEVKIDSYDETSQTIYA